ncbi:MAG: hypothetical protein AB8B69_12600 [Chitinophagales bacterium]
MYIFSKQSMLLVVFMWMPLFLVGQNANVDSESKPKTDKQFYVGFTTGIGVNKTNVNKEVNFGNRLGVVLPIQPSLTYRWNDVWSLELMGGLHVKQYKLSVDRFFTSSSNFIRPQTNLTTTESNATLGLHLHFRKPLNSKKSVYLGGVVGYGRLWQLYEGIGGSGSCMGADLSSGLQLPFAIPGDCEKSYQADYEFTGSNLGYVFIGANLEFLMNPAKALQSPILRFSLVHQGTRFGTPMMGDMTFYEGTETVEQVDYYNSGSYVAFEVGYLFPLGKNKIE